MRKEGFTVITDNDILDLIPQVQNSLSAERFSHTLGVMRAAELLGEYCLPGRTCELKAAALLHDIAKELSFDELLVKLVDEFDIDAKTASADLSEFIETAKRSGVILS